MQKYGLIGKRLGHSFSSSFFNDKFKAEGIDAEYVNFEIPQIEDIRSIIEGNPNLCGLNVTIPYKEQIIPYLDELDDDAKSIGAVNVIKIIRQKGKTKLVGYNSDVIGFRQSIEPLLEPHHTHALILGMGGAAKAVYHGLKKCNDIVKEIHFVARIPGKDRFTYADIRTKMIKEYTLIVNCTPVGMYPNVDECPDIPYDKLTPKHFLYDLLYNPNQTLFMKKGEARGAATKNGLEMLILQAFASWEIWNA
jgi:shikimate dehydrogenase